jgi:RimJ/RimL family protein N-acetyltransferase
MEEGIVGCGGYKGIPKEGRVEIAYGTFKSFERRGIATEICNLLVQLSLQTDPAVRIMARTLRDNQPSMAVLKKNLFECLGLVQDDEDGEVFEWEFMGKSR